MISIDHAVKIIKAQKAPSPIILDATGAPEGADFYREFYRHFEDEITEGKVLRVMCKVLDDSDTHFISEQAKTRELIVFEEMEASLPVVTRKLWEIIIGERKSQVVIILRHKEHIHLLDPALTNKCVLI